MTTLTPYLLFDGKCQQAMEFYNSCFGGDLAATKVKDSPAKDFMPAFQQEKIVNARLRNGELEISASDWLRPAQTPIRGNTVCLYLSGGTLEELKTLFERLSDAAEVTAPLKSSFSAPTEHSTTNSVSGGCFKQTRSRRQTASRKPNDNRSESYEIHFADVRHEGRR